MIKGLLISNILAIVLSCASMVVIYAPHTDIFVTKNDILHGKIIREINKSNEIDEIKKSYITFIESNRTSRDIHNKNSRKSLYVVSGVLFMLILNLGILIAWRRRHSNAT